MNKKVNTLLFILGATVFNVITAILCIVLFTILFSMTIAPRVSDSVQVWVIGFIFLAAIAASFFIYRFLLKYLIKKIDMDKYFDPIFGKKYIKKS